MAKLTGPLMSLDAAGPFGDVLGFMRLGSRPVVRSRAAASMDRRAGRKRAASQGQVVQRARFGTVRLMWQSLTPEQQAQWRADADRLHENVFAFYAGYWLPRIGTAWDNGTTLWDDAETLWT